jgi:hypothetical protein
VRARRSPVPPLPPPEKEEIKKNIYEMFWFLFLLKKMERPIKKHQDIVPLTNEEIALQEQLIKMAGGRGGGRDQILNKDPIAKLLVHLDPVRMYYITDRDFSHTFVKYDADLQNLWEKIANLWWKSKENNIGVNLGEIIEQLKKIGVGVEDIDYYRLILCNWLLKKTFNANDMFMVRCDLYFEKKYIGSLTIKAKTTTESFKLVLQRSSTQLAIKYDEIVKILPNVRTKRTSNVYRKAKTKTRLSSFCFLYKILSIENLWIDVPLEQTAQQYFKNSEKLEKYKNMLYERRSRIQNKEENEHCRELYDFPIWDDTIMFCDQMIQRFNYSNYLDITDGDDHIKFRRNYDTFEISFEPSNWLCQRVISCLFKNVDFKKDYDDWKMIDIYKYKNFPDQETLVVVFYTFAVNLYRVNNMEKKKISKNYLVREKISK